MDKIWEAGLKKQKLGIQTLPIDIRACVTNGDGVADHYGGRTNFTFLEQRQDRILLLEKVDGDNAQAHIAVNMTGGYGTGILGSAIDEIAPKVREVFHSSVTTNDEFHSVERLQLVSNIKEMIASHTGSQERQWSITFTSTGSEAMDLALQLIHLEGMNLTTGVDSRSKKDIVFACHGAWHGWSQGPNQLLDRKQFTEGVPRIRGVEVVFLQYGDIENLRSQFSNYEGRIRAVSVEGILGDGGVISASSEWWSELFKLSEEEDARIIDDEILTGFRTGGVLAIPKRLSPDCITLGKALGFGLFPMSAVLWRNDRLSLRPGIGVRTFNARPFQAAVVNAGIDMIKGQGLFERSITIGSKLIDDISLLSARYPTVVKAVRGKGMFIGLELSDAFARRGRMVRDTFLRHGVLTEIESGLFNRKVPKDKRINETIRITPPLTISADSIEEALRALLEGVKELQKINEQNAA
ncbi:aminotransferase class III-fold pyridoxal phosphate-dependent enzyme [Pseudomonas viridiflava]|uniref:aminotransferase class III-fold pyridoxal phosphate-dependent enzyme n=1 Tax=Pseudomonas viridiflava TaxID=33069 RepID=UPI000F03931B|nr:aminotransferase class III-fold pyridoxal phosphate-dependent enzyme [Pseudomonas viridiflava]